MNQDLISFYRNDLLPVIDKQQELSDLNPTDKGDRFELGCPECGKREAFIYKNSDFIQCNRKNNCGTGRSMLQHLSGGKNPQGKEWVELVKQLAEKYGVSFPNTEYSKEEIERFDQQQNQQNILRDFLSIVKAALYSDQGKHALEYLKNERNLSPEIIAKQEFGYYPSKEHIKKELENRGYLPDEIHKSGLYREDWDGRPIWPIKERGIVGFFNTRAIEGSKVQDPKYIRMANAPDNSAMLGLNNAENDLILVEGQFDQIALTNAGFNNVVSVGGSLLWAEHISKLKQHKTTSITLFLDNDEAGKQGVQKVIEKYINENFEIYAIDPALLDDCKDPDEYLNKYGVESLQKIIKQRKIWSEYLLNSLIKNQKINNEWSYDAKKNAIDEAEKVLKKAPQSRILAVSHFWEMAIEEMGIDEQTMNEIKKESEEKTKKEECEKETKRYERETKLLLQKGDYEGLKKEAKIHADSLQKLQRTNSSQNGIKFIKDRDINFFTSTPPDAPRLVSVIEKGKIHPFIQKGIVGQIVGAGGIGKTHLLAQLALSVATGRDFLNKYKIERPGYVFMGLGENSDDDIHRLLYKHFISISNNIESNGQLTLKEKDEEKNLIKERASDRLSVHSFHGSSASFIDEEGERTEFYNNLLQDLKKAEPEEGWSLIILDPVSRFLGADAENDNASATRFIECLERITLDLKGNPTVIFGHHKNKSGIKDTTSDQSAARGSSAITDGVRWQANLDPVPKEDNNNEIDPTRVKFKVVKSNLTPPQEPIILKKGDGGVMTYEASDKYKPATPDKSTSQKKQSNDDKNEELFNIGRRSK